MVYFFQSTEMKIEQNGQRQKGKQKLQNQTPPPPKTLKKKKTMKQALFKNLSSICTRNFLSPQTLKPQNLINGNNNILPLTSLSPSPQFRLRLLSSKADSFSANSDSVAENNSAKTQIEESSTDVDDVSREELRRRIERFFGGDEEAIPSIFEAILKRKLAGKHDDSDDELIEEFGRKIANDVSDEEFDSEED